MKNHVLVNLLLSVFIVFPVTLSAMQSASTDSVFYNKDTYTYKSVDKHEIRLDVYRVPTEDVQPVIMWIHGGALIMGNRGIIRREQLEMYLEEGYTVISIDYRLAPETKLPEIIDDVRDAHQWIRNEGSKLFSIDPDRINVIGHSAGGYLTLMTGFCVSPRPRALVSFYGYGDIIGSWYSRPDSFYNQQPAVSRDEAYSVVTDSTISGSYWRRSQFYLYCRQNGLWPKAVSGHDPFREAEWFEQYCPVQNVTEDFPPTLLLHGDQDTDVPFRQSVMMAKEFAKHDVEHQFIKLKNLGHGFDGRHGIKNPVVIEALRSVRTFLQKNNRLQ